MRAEWLEEQETCTVYRCASCGRRSRSKNRPEDHECELPYAHNCPIRDGATPDIVADYLLEYCTKPMLDYLRQRLSPEGEAAWRLARSEKNGG